MKYGSLQIKKEGLRVARLLMVLSSISTLFILVGLFEGIHVIPEFLVYWILFIDDILFQ